MDFGKFLKGEAMKTEHGYDIVESFKVEDRYIVRVNRDGLGHLHGHVVWNMTGDGKCTNGSYFSTPEEAKKCFEERKAIL